MSEQIESRVRITAEQWRKEVHLVFMMESEADTEKLFALIEREIEAGGIQIGPARFAPGEINRGG